MLALTLMSRSRTIRADVPRLPVLHSHLLVVTVLLFISLALPAPYATDWTDG